MADFCRQCVKDLWGEDASDFVNITPEKDWSAGKAVQVLCEGCGWIQVNPEGECVSEDCMRPGHNAQWAVESKSGDGQGSES